MKIPAAFRSDRIWLALMLSALALVAFIIWAVVLSRALEPEPLEWQSIAPPVVVGTALTIDAKTHRDPGVVYDPACSNTFQVDIRSGRSVSRLPVPTRTITDDRSVYETYLPRHLQSGPYEVRLVESYFCNGIRRAVESPWIGFEVVK